MLIFRFLAGLERQPLHKHNFARSNQDAIAQHSSSSVRCQSRSACQVAFKHPTGRPSTSAVCCRRSSQGCQPPTPGQLAPHVASWHKQHLQTATSVPLANSRRAQQAPAAPSRHSPSGCDGPDADTRGISGVQPVQLHSTMVFALSLSNAYHE